MLLPKFLFLPLLLFVLYFYVWLRSYLFHPYRQNACDLRSLSLRFRQNNLFTQPQLSQLAFNPDTDPFGVDVDFDVLGFHMLGHLYLEEGVFRMVVLSELEWELSLVALPDFTLLVEHGGRDFFNVLLRILLTLLSLLVFGHVIVHLSTGFFRIRLFVVLFLPVGLASGLLLFHFSLLLSLFMLPLLSEQVKISLQVREVLNSLDPLGGRDDGPVVGFEGSHPSYDIVLTARPVFAGISGEVYFLDVGELTEAGGTFFEVFDVDEVDSEVEFLEAFAPLDVLYFGDIVERHVEILQFLELVEVLQLFDDVVLQVQDLQMAAKHIQVLYFDDFLLVEGYLSWLNTVPLPGTSACIRCARSVFSGALR